MLIIEGTRTNRQIQQAAATMAIEDMYLGKQFLLEAIKAANDEKTWNELEKKVTARYVR